METAIVVVLVIVAAVVFGIILPARQKSKRDNLSGNALTIELDTFRAELPTTIVDPRLGIEAYEGLRLGEVSRHFDSNTLGTVSGWMAHNFGFHGWGVGVGVGRFGLGTGRLGLSGTSDVSLTLSATSRDNLMSDGFVAVLEHVDGNRIDTLRVVVPSEQASRELVREFFEEMLAKFGTRSNGELKLDYPTPYAILQRNSRDLMNFRYEASYVSDRLHGILRMPPETRPLISVFGQQLSDHAILGAAILIGEESQLIPLFPVALLKGIAPIVERAVVVARQTGPV